LVGVHASDAGGGQGVLASLVVHDDQPQTSLNRIEMLVVAHRLRLKSTAHRGPLVAVCHHHSRAPSCSRKGGVQKQRIRVKLREFGVLGVAFLRGYKDEQSTRECNEQKAGGEFRHGRTDC